MSEEDLDLEFQIHQENDVASEIARGIQYVLSTRAKRFEREGYTAASIVNGASIALAAALCDHHYSSLQQGERAREAVVLKVRAWFDVMKEHTEKQKEERR